MQCNAMQCNAMQCDAMRCDARRGEAMVNFVSNSSFKSQPWVCNAGTGLNTQVPYIIQHTLAISDIFLNFTITPGFWTRDVTA